MTSGLAIIVVGFLVYLIQCYREGYLSLRTARIVLALAVLPFGLSIGYHSGLGFYLSFFWLIALCLGLGFRYGADSSWFNDPVGQKRKLR